MMPKQMWGALRKKALRYGRSLAGAGHVHSTEVKQRLPMQRPTLATCSLPRIPKAEQHSTFSPAGSTAARYGTLLSARIGLALALTIECFALVADHNAWAQDAGAVAQVGPTDRDQSEHAEAEVCRDPFCTYGPPRLGGRDMAAAAKEIIAAAKAVRYGFLPDNQPAEEAFVRAFLRNDQLDFISPYYIAEHKDDPRLVDILGAACIEELTEVPYENGPTSIFSGPLYLYKVRPPLASLAEYDGVFVFGGATVAQVKGMTLEERVSRAQSAGYFYLLAPAERCSIVYKLPIDGRGEREFVARYMPRLDGVGYHEDSVLVYTLLSASVPADTTPSYSFRWIHLRPQMDGKWSAGSFGSVLLSGFPENFDPVAIVESKEDSQ